MSLSSRERIVVSVGGSLIVPDQIDTQFLSSFRALIEKKVGEGFSFYIITGGGKTARRYQEAAKAIYPETTREHLDWVGIGATKINAELMRSLFNAPLVALTPGEEVDMNAPVLVGGGTRPGNSSDLATVEAAKRIGAAKLVNLSNIDYVYTADPRKDPNAQKIEKISWPDFRKLIPSEWDAGMSSPFDPVAAKEAEAMGLEVVVMNGAHLEAFENYLDGKPFIGTVIS